MARQPSGASRLIGQQRFDLRVDRPQLVARPPLEDLVELRTDPQQIALALGR
jgi:hypothetical protein